MALEKKLNAEEKKKEIKYLSIPIMMKKIGLISILTISYGSSQSYYSKYSKESLSNIDGFSPNPSNHLLAITIKEWFTK